LTKPVAVNTGLALPRSLWFRRDLWRQKTRVPVLSHALFAWSCV